MSIVEYHRTMLGDRTRNHALAEALKKTVRKGDTVIDIGSGTGFLAMLARGLGAGHCILIERDPDVATLCRELLRENGVKSCTVMEGDSHALRGLPKADVIVSETLGNFAYEENIIEILNDAARFLKPGGQMIPHAITQYIAPVTSPVFHDELTVWRHVGYDMTFHAAELRSANNMYVRDIAREHLLEGENSRQAWDRVVFTEKNASVREGKAMWPVEGDGSVFGFCMWWECELAKGVTLSTAPDAPSTHWKQIYLPLVTPLHLVTGDTLRIELRSDSRPEVKINVTWTVTHVRSNGTEETQSMDMMNGY